VTVGAWGNRLQASGLAIGECPESWKLSHLDQVEAVARAYVEADSKEILCNTFGANCLNRTRHELAE